MVPSPKICATCKREKCTDVNKWEPNRCHTPHGGPHGSCPPAEKEADEMRVAEEILEELDRWNHVGKLEILVNALHEAKAQGRREMRKECREAVENLFVSPKFPHDTETLKALIDGMKKMKDAVLDTIKD